MRKNRKNDSHTRRKSLHELGLDLTDQQIWQAALYREDVE